MIVKYEHIKRLVCLVLCAILVVGTFLWGNNLMGSTNSFLNNAYNSQTGSISLNKGSYSGSDTLQITGYGGGGYASNAPNATPADINELMLQAEKAYADYKKSGNIKEIQMGGSSACDSYGIIDVNNKTDVSVDIKKILNNTPSLGTVTKTEPYILIFHTHSTEGYELLDLGWYSTEYVSRTADKNRNMIRVGDELTLALQEAGYNVIHDRNIYDNSYTGAYGRSRVTVEKYLKEYPSIMLTIDVHRDAIHYDDGTRCKPTAFVNGKKAAQVMIITGCEGGGVSDFPSWEQNLTFALHLQNTVEESYEGLMRPVFFCHRKYNMDVTPCSLLLEFGTDANTLQEAVYSAQLVGESLGRMLDKYV